MQDLLQYQIHLDLTREETVSEWHIEEGCISKDVASKADSGDVFHIRKAHLETEL